jgi:hypothetical protein
LDSSQYSGNETTVKTVDCEGEDGLIGCEGDDGCFWDSHEILLIDYLEKGKSITGVYYASLLATKIPHLKKKKVLFHQDNAPVHNSAVAMAKIHELSAVQID